METLVENKTVNLFEDKTSDTPSPFYTNEKMSFYKNRLISIEEIVEMKNTSSDWDENTKKHFDVFDFGSNYALTFKDEQGNTHIQISKKKPKQIGDIFYYVTNDDKLTYIAHETNKESLKQFISLNKGGYGDYDDINIKFKLLSFFEKRPKLFISSMLTLWAMTAVFCIYCVVFHKTSVPYVLTAVLGFIQPFLSSSIMLKIQEKCDEKIDKIISDRRETIFNTFI